MKISELAWDYFYQALNDKEKIKAMPFPEIPTEKAEKFFWTMVASIRKTNIPVDLIEQPFSESVAYSGKHFRPNGRCMVKWPNMFWLDYLKDGAWPKPETLRILIYSLARSPRIIAHEFAHAVNFYVNGPAGTDEAAEFVASAAGYLFVCDYLDIYSPLKDAEYALKQGSAPWMLIYLRKTVFEVFEKMKSAIENKEALIEAKALAPI